MASEYVLWDVTTGDWIGSYESEAEAVAVLCRRLGADGAASILALGLTRVSQDSRLYPVAEADALLEYVEHSN